MKKEEIDVIVLMIRNLGIENEVREALSSNSEKPLPQKEKTSNGYRIYYDKTSNDAVGIIYKNVVFLKETSEKKLNWDDAVTYCKTIVINGITSQLCPVDRNWKTEFDSIAKDLYTALKEIGARRLDDWTWCSEYSNTGYAWIQYFSDGYVYDYYLKGSTCYVRPVLILQEI